MNAIEADVVKPIFLQQLITTVITAQATLRELKRTIDLYRKKTKQGSEVL